jgi:predicted Zn finger-like uncharacterized protein
LNFTCNNCQKRYSIADEKVRGKTVKVRCKNCQSVISVEGPQLPLEESTRVVSLADVERLRAQERSLAEPEPGGGAVVSSPVVTAPPAAKAPAAPQMPWDEEPTRAAPLRALASPWFVMVRNKQEGPLDEAGLRELIATGAVSGRSFFWQQGMADWKRGTDVPELAGLFAPPPAPEPLPPPPPPLMEEPEQPTTPGRASRGAAARREPEPQSFMPEPEPPPEQEQPEPQQAWAQEPEPRQQAWAPEEPQQDTAEQAYYPEPAARAQPQQGRRGQAASAGPLNDDQLFSDLDLPDNRGGGNELGDEGNNDPGGAGWPEEEDRLAAQGGDDAGEPPAPVDDKRRASVKKKAPAPRRGSAGKKVALSLLLLLLLMVGGAFVLDMLNVVPLRVKTVDAQGNPVERSFFSAEGASALTDKLMGRAPPAPKAAPVAPPANSPEAAPAQPAPSEPPSAPADGAAGAGTESGAAAAPADGTKQAAQDVAPGKEGESAEAGKAAAAAPLLDSPSDEEVERVVEQAQVSFRECVKAELKKNPAFRGGKVTLTATVGNTGAVKEAVLSRKGMDRTPVGTCLRERAKGMVFSPFAGEDVDLDIEVDLSKKSL